MEDQANQEMASIREALEASQQDLLSQMAAAQAELTKLIETQQQQLETDKVGRQSLALMLDEVALRLRGEKD